MITNPQPITPAEALTLNTPVTPTEQGIASRVLARTAGGNLTMVVPLEAIRNITCQADVVAGRISVAADNVDEPFGDAVHARDIVRTELAAAAFV